VAVTQKLGCIVEEIVSHGERVYTLALRPERQLPRFRAGQFLHLALDPYDPTGFWPESRVFSIASPPAQRDSVRITYAVHGAFTARMESDLAEGHQVWIKMPYGDFVIEPDTDVVLFAGGTGVTAFTAFLEDLPDSAQHSVTVAYGARHANLLIYRDVVERCVTRVPAVQVTYFIEPDDAVPVAPTEGRVQWSAGRVSVSAIWPRLRDPFEAEYYISGPPPMLRGIGDDLRSRNISPEAIHIDAWE
jgi:ferredoxin-NADP reductase